MKLIDISHILSADTPIYPGDYKTTLSEYKSLEKDCFCSYLLSSGLHTGTHIDIPMHLINDERTVSDFPPDHFIGKGVLLDVRGENPISMKPYYEEVVGNRTVVLLFTGFDKHYYTEDYFACHPVVSDELTGFLISKKIKMLGLDAPAPDYPPFAVHKSLLSNGIFILENITNLQSLQGISNFEVIAFPLKIAAEASLVRAVCRVG